VANALYLNRGHFLLYQRTLPKELRSDWRAIDSEDYSSFKLLRNCLRAPGLLHGRIESAFVEMVRIDTLYDELSKLIDSDEEIARICLRDLSLTANEHNSILASNGGDLSHGDLLTPLCRWLPGAVVWTLRSLIIARIEALANEGLENVNAPVETADPSTEVYDTRSESLASRRAMAIDLIEEVVSFYSSRERRPTAKDLQLLVADRFKLTPNGAKTAWEMANVERSEFKNPKKSERLDMEELRAFKNIERKKI